MIFGVEIDRVAARYGEMAFAAKDPVIGQSLKLYGEWAEPELDVAARFIDGDACVIDVGANIGTHAIGLAHRFPGTPVIAVEPQPLAFALLCANVVSCDQGIIEPVHAALGARRGTLTATYDYEAVGWNIGAVNIRRNRLQGGTSAPVPMLTLDALVNERAVQFIKMDVEGMEPLVLSGALETLRRSRPVILFEVLTIAMLRKAMKVLDGLGYELRWCETAAFNLDNFNRHPHNLWELGETSVLALPKADDPRAQDFPLVSGLETRVPRVAFLRGTANAPAFVEFAAVQTSADDIVAQDAESLLGQDAQTDTPASPVETPITQDAPVAETLTKEDVLARVAAVIAKLFRYPADEVDMETTAAEVNGWDSLSHVTFVMEVESALDVIFDPYAVQGFGNVGDLVEEVVRLK